MPKPAHADGPWGEAIEYWLKERRMRQADLVRASGVEAKTVSSITRGFHTTTRVLSKLADALGVPLDAILVSPDRKSAREERKREAMEIAEEVMQKIEARRAPPLSADQRIQQAANDIRAAAAQRASEAITRSAPAHSRARKR